MPRHPSISLHHQFPVQPRPPLSRHSPRGPGSRTLLTAHRCICMGHMTREGPPTSCTDVWLKEMPSRSTQIIEIIIKRKRMGGLPRELGPCDSALVVGRRASPRDPRSQAAGRRGVPCAVHALHREFVLQLRSLLPKSGPLCPPPTLVRGRGSMPLGNIRLEEKRGAASKSSL